MSTLFTAASAVSVTTANGAGAYATTGAKTLDLFGAIGAMRNNVASALPMFGDALAENAELTMKILLWAYDVRMGAGERDVFKVLALSFLTDDRYAYKTKAALIQKIPELGRWDMLVDLIQSERLPSAIVHYAAALIRANLDTGNALCAKWMPRQGKTAGRLRGFFRLTPKQWRKLLAAVSGNTVERLMSEKRWGEIVYEHVPSVAMSRYKKAFRRNDPERFQAYLEAVSDGKAEIKATAVMPYDVLRNTDNLEATVAQWNALPNYVGDAGNVLVMADVSGSMECHVSGSVKAIDIAIGLAIYLSERNNGIFKDEVIAYSDVPKMFKLSGDVIQKVRTIRGNTNPFNTDIGAAMRLILRAAVSNRISEDEMPKKLIIISDMQFDPVELEKRGNSGIPAIPYDALRAEFLAAGYAMPKILFWNVSAAVGHGTPVSKEHKGCSIVSGFSLAIAKGIMSGMADPFSFMLETVDKERYTLPF